MSARTRAPRLVFTGSVVVDLVMTVDRLPDLGGDTIASASQITAGGGYNVMVAARQDGLDVLFAGQYGTGPFGSIVRAALADGGFEVVQDGLPDQENGYCVALVDAAAERTFVTAVGAEAQLRRGDLDRIEPRPADLVYVSGYSLAHPVNRDALVGWLADLPDDVPVLTDPCPLIGELEPAALTAVLARTDVLSLNAREARIATGSADPAVAAVDLLGRIRNGGFVVLRDGAAGCWLAGPVGDEVGDEGGDEVGDKVRDGGVSAQLVPGFAVAAVDSSGAGDTHCGVLAAALARGETPAQAARRANAAAALATTRPGPASAPDAAAIDAMLARC